MSIKNKLKNFKLAIYGEGEQYFSMGSDAKDYAYIMRVLNTTGYWAGIYNRYYFNDNLELIKLESRF